jgi:secreted trypsin-like serine protease
MNTSSLSLRTGSNNDSGSPIIVPGRTPLQDRLVGMVSWGTECADPDFPGTCGRHLVVQSVRWSIGGRLVVDWLVG